MAIDVKKLFEVKAKNDALVQELAREWVKRFRYNYGELVLSELKNIAQNKA